MIEHVLLNNSQFGCEVFTAETALIRQMSDHTLQHMHKLHLDYQMLSNEKFAKSATADWCTVNFTGEPAQITALTQDLLIRYPHVFDVTSSMPTFCEITAAGVNKGSVSYTHLFHARTADRNYHCDLHRTQGAEECRPCAGTNRQRRKDHADPRRVHPEPVSYTHLGGSGELYS